MNTSFVTPEISHRRRLVFFSSKNYQTTYQVQYRFIDLVFVNRLAAALKKQKPTKSLFPTGEKELGKTALNGMRVNAVLVLYSELWHDSSCVRKISLNMHCGSSIAVVINALLSITLPG